LGQDEEETTTVVVKMTARLEDETGGDTASRLERAISRRFSLAPSVDKVSFFELI
jgi:hypothetical protein